MVTTITCYGGVGEIGGNKILLEDGQRRLLLDFGKDFGRYGTFFDGVFIKERPTRGVLDPLSLGLIPPLRGLLRDDLVPALREADLQTETLPLSGRQKKERVRSDLRPQAVESFWEAWKRRYPRLYRDLRRTNAAPVDLILLSHAHQDHISDLAYVSPDIPAGSTAVTAFISKVLLDVAGGGDSGAPFTNPRILSKSGVLIADKDQPLIARPWHFLDRAPAGDPNGDPLRTARSFWAQSGTKSLSPRSYEGPIGAGVRFWPVDHSIPGATGYAVDTAAGWVAYTGDIRFHGRSGENTWRFGEGLASLRPKALLCEGTRLTEPNRTSEQEVGENCLRAVQEAQGKLVVADFAPRNVERLVAFASVAAQTGRRLLVQPRDAYLLRAIALADPQLGDAMEDEHVGLYADPKAQIRAWEEAVRVRYRERTVSPLEVKDDPGAYILAFSLTEMSDMVDIEYLMNGRIGGIYVFSNSQAYDEEQKVDLVRLWSWTEYLGLKMVGLVPSQKGAGGEVREVIPEPGYHASGHAGGDELVEFVRTVNPETLIPIHTEAAGKWLGLLQGSGIKVCLPEMGSPISLD